VACPLLNPAAEVKRAQQGGSVWKWPSDTVARIDTSVHRLQFTADQITRERVGVQVTGLAVFRIVAPLVAWGVVIDTIEIQDVRVLSAEVFERMRLESEIERATRVATHKALEQQAQLAMEREKAEANVETARLEAAAVRLRAEADADATRLARAALDMVSEGRLQELALTQTAPEVAKALRGAFGQITVRPTDLTELVGAVKAVVGR